MSKRTSLEDFFTPKHRRAAAPVAEVEDVDGADRNSPAMPQSATGFTPGAPGVSTTPAMPTPGVSTPGATTQGTGPRFDIGSAVGGNLQPGAVYRYLTAPWIPTDDYPYHPYVVMKKGAGGQKRPKTLNFQKSWLIRFPFLAYSDRDKGVYCRWCVIFAGEAAGGNKLQTLVGKPLSNWKDALEICNAHRFNKYHEEAKAKADGFIGAYQTGNVKEKLANVDPQLKEQHRTVIGAVVDVIKLAGRQNLALRGSSDHGPLENPTNFEGPPDVNEGNFRALLRFACKHSPRVANAIDAMPGNARYTSPDIQNEIISICGEMLVEKVVAKVSQAGIFTVLADETSDVSQLEQFSICLRYVEEAPDGSPCIREDFLGFQVATDLTGQHLADLILATIENVGLSPANLRGQGYDGASNMSGKFKGVQARISEKYPLALYTHCSSHALSLSLAKTSSVDAVRKLLALASDICNFFRHSPKRSQVLQNAIGTLCPEQKRQKLKPLCPTRWVERHESLIILDELYDPIVAALTQLREDKDVDTVTGTKAAQLYSSVVTLEFVAALKCCVFIFSECLNVSIALQSRDCDLIGASVMLKELAADYKGYRDAAEGTFGKIYADIVSVTAKHAILPAARRGGIVDDPEKYFRTRLFIPALDAIIQQMSTRFSAFFGKAVVGYALIPAFMNAHDTEESVAQLLQMYGDDLPSPSVVSAEARQWNRKWQNVATADLPKTAIDTMAAASPMFFPSIRKIMKILATLPVTTASAERSFSCLTRLKTYLRNAMTTERLSGLAMLNVHRDMDLPTADVVQRFAMQKGRRLDLTL